MVSYDPSSSSSLRICFAFIVRQAKIIKKAHKKVMAYLFLASNMIWGIIHIVFNIKNTVHLIKNSILTAA